ncbi:MAG: AAA family ATPase, partial [Muribaculaceae bacterium]|nr:AAA family ATPase [Muribaculaceae bacterium]
SQIAQCFEAYGTDARIALLKRFSPPANTAAVNLGNFASQLLDDALHSSSSEHDYADSVLSFFRNNALNLASCDINRDFHVEGRNQKKNIERAISSHIPQSVKNFDPGNLMVEPAFFCERLGLQGRMDMLQLDFRLLLEQKAGKGEWPQGNFSVPRHRQSHYIQLLLYMAIIRYNFPERYAANRRQLSAFLLYSKYSQPLAAPGYAPESVAEAMAVRNEIVYHQRLLAEGDTAFLRTLTPEHLKHNAVSPKLWDNYSRPALDSILSPLHSADRLAVEYFYRMLQFVSLEQAIARSGNKSKQASGQAALWNSSFEEKLDAGNIYAGLILETPATDSRGRVESLSLSFVDDGRNALANFRIGDIVLLYSYKAGEEPDVRQTMFFRCTLAEASKDSLRLTLRVPQSSTLPFATQPDTRWAIEHDSLDSSFGTLYYGLHRFLSMPLTMRDLLLGRREPEVDTSQSLSLDHGAFNNLALRVKQARDLFLIIGPPGTGKTSYGLMSTLKEELYDTEASVLLLSYTNRAVDEICSKLEEEGIDYLRIGPPSSCDPQYRTHLLSERVGDCANIAEVRRLIKSARICAATTSSLNANINLLSIRKFSIAIVDEASQITEPQIIGILSATDAQGRQAIGKYVMIGDHKQLPAVVQQTAREASVDNSDLRAIGLTDCRMSLFERLLRRYKDKPDVTYMLTRQGRMHTDIAAFPSESFYGGMLKPVPLPHQTKATDCGDDCFAAGRMMFFDIEADPADASDKVNSAEAGLIARLAAAIAAREDDFTGDTLGVIVPYRNQINAVRLELERTGVEALSDVTVDTVERFQGSQRKYIIYGFTVRRPAQLRFLSEHRFTDDNGAVIDRKLNVALTRAREYMICAGDASLLRSDPVFAALIAHIDKAGGYYSAAQSSQ